MRLLVGLQRVSELVQSFSGCFDPNSIAKRATDGLVKKFDCAFARIWLMEPDGAALRLVASSGMYTNTNGFFSKVPLGAFKVGKIAQNRIPFLSNNLADEPWVKDRDWAIAKQITGFAGYPLVIDDKVIGVLAVFSHQPLSPEFLEILQGLCTTLAITLEISIHLQQPGSPSSVITFAHAPLSEQLSQILSHTRFILVGTERPLSPSFAFLLLRSAEILQTMDCSYCRFSYGSEQITLEAVVLPQTELHHLRDWVTSRFSDLLLAVTYLGGTLQTFIGANQNVVQVVLQLPYPCCPLGPWIRIHCQLPLLQTAFTQLAYQAGLMFGSLEDAQIPLLTDDPKQASAAVSPVLWIAHNRFIPKGITAKLDLTTTATQLRSAIEAVMRGETWGLETTIESPRQSLSEREQEILELLMQGARDRDIATALHISERTVKFHINNLLTKLNARTRCQAIYHAIESD
jgi:DNA-binding CsgD family transcriptional regulator